MCSWGCTYFFGGFLVGRVLMKNTHLNEILAVNNWQLTFWILGESVLLCPSHNHYNFQVLPRGTPVAQEFFRHTTLLYMQCTGHTMPYCALSMNGFRRRKFTTSALMKQCLAKKNISVFGQPKFSCQCMVTVVFGNSSRCKRTWKTVLQT